MTTEAAPRWLLVVDDEEGLLLLMTDVLKHEGYRVDMAESGQKALEWLSDNAPDLVLLDLNLGDMPASKLIESLRAQGRSFPFVIITGHGDERTAVQMMKEGALDYVMKDLGLMDLLPGVVRRAMSAVDREQQLISANAEQRRLEREILQISEDEKRRIGRELHDGLGQHLTALEFMSQSLARSLESKAPELSETAREIARQIRQTVAQSRRLSHGLAPVTLEEGGLFDAFQELAKTTSAAGLACELIGKPPDKRLDSSVSIHLYRIAQEAITNAFKHAGASRILISLRELPDRLDLSIQDDGKGLPPANGRGHGMGLHVMQYRARLIGANLAVDDSSEGGVRIVCSLPTRRVP